jgi:hypothetical protein
VLHFEVEFAQLSAPSSPRRGLGHWQAVSLLRHAVPTHP